MPLFDFRCRHCHATFELLIRSADTPICPACASQTLEKLVSKPAPPGKAAGVLHSARTQAAREGHFSHYAPAERPKGK